MRKTWIAKAGLASVIIGCGAMASAQSSGPTGLSPRIGIFFPTSSGLGSTFFGVGLDYKLNALSSSMMGSNLVGYWGLSADYYTEGGNSNIPVVINYNLRQGQLVYTLGAGIDFYDIPRFNGSGTGFDAQAAVSYDIAPGPVPIFVQAKYFLASRNHLSGIGLYAGVRF